VISPTTYDIPHATFRPGQGEAIEWLLESPSATINIVAALTGSGKSTLVAAMGSQHRSALSLVHSKSLQDQYASSYGFVTLKGMNSYDCAFNPFFRADTCVFAPKMFDCAVHESCAYLAQRVRFNEASRRSTNYSYYFASDVVKSMEVDWIALDEAHKLPRLLMSHYTLDLTMTKLVEMDLPSYKQFSTNDERLKYSVGWLEQAMAILRSRIEVLRAAKNKKRKEQQGGLVAKINQLMAIGIKFSMVHRGIQQHQDEWYSWFDDDVMRIAPLSARTLFNQTFGSTDAKLLLMSATIGQPELFARSLGIASYRYRDIPSQFTYDERPVYVLKGSPKMGHSTANEQTRAKQAYIIAQSIRSHCHPTWSGIVHVNSKRKANDLAERLSKLGMSERVYVAEGQGTDAKLTGWGNRKQVRRNSICISYSFEEGVDMGEENFCISADIPFAYLGDPIEKARMDFDPVLYKAEAANRLEQRSGRIRRGLPEHYDTADSRNGFVAIADKNWRMVESQLSDDFKACIKEI
jgi:Rad3-related DNA helicase